MPNGQPKLSAFRRLDIRGRAQFLLFCFCRRPVSSPGLPCSSETTGRLSKFCIKLSVRILFATNRCKAMYPGFSQHMHPVLSSSDVAHLQKPRLRIRSLTLRHISSLCRCVANKPPTLARLSQPLSSNIPLFVQSQAQPSLAVVRCKASETKHQKGRGFQESSHSLIDLETHGSDPQDETRSCPPDPAR